MAQVAEKLATIEDLLALNDGTDTRYELHAGRLVAMAPASQAHGEIVMRLGRLLGDGLHAPCRIIAEAGLPFRDQAESYYQADLAITCEPRESGQIWVREPLVIVEVLSPSTAATDFQRKLPDYRRIASLRDILLVDSTQARIQHFFRDDGRWLVEDLASGDRLRLAALGVEVDVAGIYRDIPLGRAGATTAGETR